MNNENQPPENNHQSERFIEPEVQKMGFFNRLISIFAAPRELFLNIKEYPVFLPVIIISILIGLTVMPLTTEYTTIVARENYNLSMELFGYDRFNQGLLLAEHDEYGEAIPGMGAAMQVMTVIGLIIGPWLMIFFAALGLFVVSKIARGHAKLGRFFSMYAHIYVVSSIGAAVVLLLAVMNNSVMDFTSLAPIFMPDGNLSQPLFLLLTYISIVRVWEAALVFVGVQTINDFSAAKAGAVTAVFVLVSAAISMAAALMWHM